jgi:hypothetical protein
MRPPIRPPRFNQPDNICQVNCPFLVQTILLSTNTPSYCYNGYSPTQGLARPCTVRIFAVETMCYVKLRLGTLHATLIVW